MNTSGPYSDRKRCPRCRKRTRPDSGRSSGSMRRWPNTELQRPNRFLGGGLPNTLLRRMVAGARPAQGLLQRTTGRAGRRAFDAEIASGVEHSTGAMVRQKPHNAVPSGRGTLGARSIAQRQPGKLGSVRFRGAKRREGLYGAFRTPFSSTITSGRGHRGSTSRRRGFLVGRQPLACSTAGRRAKHKLTFYLSDGGRLETRRQSDLSSASAYVRSGRSRAMSTPSANAAPKSICSPTSASCRTVPMC